ncbi:hypothetical protein B0H10DRAFT_2212585 [Mycena sp. CBHHK59/15]|nr:hypothetical protein B0H10DRAFT_2212585 [Mycena sp. CBHHK59/15]
MFMQSCFQSGMGAKQFSDALCLWHLEYYDTLQIKYVSALARQKGMTAWDLYDKFIEDHDHDFNQAIALLTALICAIDHSFKLTKHIAKVNGEQVFIALLTITNEKGEICVCNLVATKSHSQFELALEHMRESLILYSHDQPAVFYTNNMLDKDFLERCFPSLREDVIAVEKYSHLEPLEIPRTTTVVEMAESDKINEVGTYNSTGKHYTGHYSIWLMNEHQELLSFLEDVLINPRFITGWVNGNLYQPMKEVAGVLPVPEDIQVKYSMA